MVSSKFHIPSHCQDQYFFLNNNSNNNNKKEQLKNPKPSWQIPFKDKKSRTGQHWDVIYILPAMSIRVHCCSLPRQYQCNLCLHMDSAYGISLWTLEQNKKCLEKMIGISQRGKLTLGRSCIFLFMVPNEYLWWWRNLQSVLLVKLSWRKKKSP